MRPTSPEALTVLLAAIAGHEPTLSFYEIRSRRASERGMRQTFVPVGERQRAVEAILAQQDADIYIGAAPRVREHGAAEDVARVWVLWCDCDTPVSVEKLRAFSPVPSIVWETSPGRRQAVWPLKESIPAEWARRANRRLAHALGADMASTDPARILRAIGTRNHKRGEPTPVMPLRCELDMFAVADVCGRLADPGISYRQLGGADTARTAGPLDALVRTVAEATIGERNGTLFWAACRASTEGHDTDRLLAAAMSAGLPEHEALRTIASAKRTAA